MNDNDIIKAYKCCTLEACNCTANCPYRGTSGKFTGEECWRKAREDVLNLINRQKAEIERLNHIRAEMSKENDRLKAEMSYMKSPNTIGDTHEMGAW